MGASSSWTGNNNGWARSDDLVLLRGQKQCGQLVALKANVGLGKGGQQKKATVSRGHPEKGSSLASERWEPESGNNGSGERCGDLGAPEEAATGDQAEKGHKEEAAYWEEGVEHDSMGRSAGRLSLQISANQNYRIRLNYRATLWCPPTLHVRTPK
ncbi:UNVERIFIED_CONTAM: hypothetical protein K2H54_045535 [Gekko kuhli]